MASVRIGIETAGGWRIAAAVAGALFLAAPAVAQQGQALERDPHADHDADHAATDPHAGHAHRHPLHLMHPLVTESPLPENEARLEFSYASLSDEDVDEFTLTGTFEFAPVQWFSIEVAAPLTHLASHESGVSDATRLGDVGVGFKFATFAFQEHGLLPAVGFEIGLPTGNEERGIGSDHVVELEPWVGLGYKRDRFEWIVRVGVGFPLNQNGEKEADAELEWSTSLLYHVVEDRLAMLVEFDGLHIFGEEEDGYNGVSVTPGVRFFPFDNPDISFGAGVRLPVTDDRESDVQGIFTLYFHY